MTSGCRGFVPAYPRHQPANPTSSEAGALQALLHVAVEALREDAQDAGCGPRLFNVIADQAGSTQISV